jgi:hypothetical protein
VASFIDSTSATWKVDLLEEHFLLVDVEVIRSIPMSNRRMIGIWAWHYEKIGVLTARSTYCLLVQTKRRREDWIEGRSTGSNSKEENHWQRRWKVQVSSIFYGAWHTNHYLLVTSATINIWLKPVVALLDMW